DDVSGAREPEEALLAVAGPGALEAQGAYELTDGKGPAEVLGSLKGVGWGRMPWVEAPIEGGVRLRFRSPGVSRWFVRRGAHGAFDGEGAPGARPSDGPLALTPLCRVQAVVSGTSRGAPLDVVATRREGSAWLGGDGWTLRRRPQEEVELLLPVGEWRIQAVAADGRSGPPTPLNLQMPGTQSSIRIEPPK